MRQPNLRDLRIEIIYAKIVREDHGRTLERTGATGVILPERDLANKLAKTLILPNPIDYLPSSEKYNVVETAPSKDFIGKTLAHLSLGNEHKINILGVRDVVPE